jgi:hypothetical protein
MEMNRYPFITSPDVLYLAIPAKVDGISFEFFESEFGITDEQLCYYEGVLIGQIAPNCCDRNHLGEDAVFIYLLPKLDPKRNYIWPTRVTFIEALRRLLAKSISWSLHCEYDCDQRPVQEINQNMPQTISELEKALIFSAGEENECPSFVSRQ